MFSVDFMQSVVSKESSFWENPKIVAVDYAGWIYVTHALTLTLTPTLTPDLTFHPLSLNLTLKPNAQPYPKS